jgi:hypothetical protein
VGQGGLASQLTCLQHFEFFCLWRFSVIGQCKVSQQNPEPDPALMGSLDWYTVAKACLKFRSWIEAVIAGDSHFIEYIDSQYVLLLISF